MSAMDWVRQRQCLNSDEKCDDIIEAAEMDDVDQHDVNNVTENSSGDAYPLLFSMIVRTGFSVYNEHTTEIAAKVVGVPLSSFSQPTFTSIVKTGRNIISKKGTN